MLTPGVGQATSVAYSSTIIQIHFQALLSIYLNFLPEPALWDEAILRRILPVLFSVLGTWAAKEPLPRIAVGKERELLSRAKSHSKAGPRKSGGIGGGKEPETEMEALQHRVETVIGICCDGPYDRTVLEVIKDSARPAQQMDAAASDQSTPTPTLAHAPIIGADVNDDQISAESGMCRYCTSVTHLIGFYNRSRGICSCSIIFCKDVK